ncbi:cysteine--tRNA ligase [Mycoplasmoides pirum]|uniref:cysteine--tRNA ligase n=1 Tax=Mycoplasmoides pirum TaxID=2122 RepID=UPI0004852AAA|nr:cysteine--tRNA ligase [Mycoplasmoides pirum]
MKIFDTYSQEYQEIKNKIINIYVCGPTVYNHVHLGNIRPLITFDVLNRYFQFQKIKVNYVHNITDIDDKIIKQAAFENVPELVLSVNYANAYLEIMNKLNVIPMKNPKVSENIEGIISYIEKLIQNQSAYVVDGNVYFDISLIPNYGSLSKMKTEDLLSGERVEVNEDKKNPLDFVLWKKTTEGIVWDSPWGKGRPGWHTECAFLINSEFNSESINIHGGGIDLRFPHHENENAQHYALFHKNITDNWMHVGHLNIDNQKMSKSTNNFIYVKQLLETYNYATIRWIFYQTHYRSPLNFNNQVLQVAVKDIERIFLTLNKSKTLLILANKPLPTNLTTNTNFLAAIEDDLNFANATKAIWSLISNINTSQNNKDYDKLITLCEELMWCLWMYGIEPQNIHNKSNIDLIKQWNNKLKNKEYDKADELRTKLMNKKLL